MRLLAATLLAWGLACASGHASTVTVSSAYPSTPTRLILLAAPGERNAVQLEAGPQPQTVRVRDAAGLTPTAPCVAEDPQTAVCPTAAYFHVELGDGDDRLAGALRETAGVAAGEGDDEVRWPTALIEGGQGADTLTGGVVDGGPGSDLLEGKTLRYNDRSEPITVDLLAGVAGAPGENDRVTGTVEQVWTGSGNDTVRATDTPLDVGLGAGDDTFTAGAGGGRADGGLGNDELTGGPGADTLLGADGQDRVEGGAGADLLSGGEGDDALDGGPGGDKLYGSSGQDLLVARDDAKDLVQCESEVLAGDRAVLDASDAPRLCELVERSGPQVLEPIAVLSDEGRRSLLVSCPTSARARACAGTVRIRGDVARPFTVKPGRRAQLSVRPRVGGHRYSVILRLRSGRTLRVTLDAIVRP